MLMKQRQLFVRVCDWPLKMSGCVFNPGFLFSLVKVLRVGNFSFSDTSTLSSVLLKGIKYFVSSSKAAFQCECVHVDMFEGDFWQPI